MNRAWCPLCVLKGSDITSAKSRKNIKICAKRGNDSENSNNLEGKQEVCGTCYQDWIKRPEFQAKYKHQLEEFWLQTQKPQGTESFEGGPHGQEGGIQTQVPALQKSQLDSDVSVWTNWPQRARIALLTCINKQGANPRFTISAEHGGKWTFERNMWLVPTQEIINHACYLDGLPFRVTLHAIVNQVHYLQRTYGSTHEAFKKCCEKEGLFKAHEEANVDSMRRSLKDFKKYTMSTLEKLASQIACITVQNFEQVKETVIGTTNRAIGQLKNSIFKLEEEKPAMDEDDTEDLASVIVKLFMDLPASGRDELLRRLARAHALLPRDKTIDLPPATFFVNCFDAYDKLASCEVIEEGGEKPERNLIHKFVTTMATQIDRVNTEYPMWLEMLHSACNYLCAATPNGVRYTESLYEFYSTVNFFMSNRGFEILVLNIPGIMSTRQIQYHKSSARFEQSEAGSDRVGYETTAEQVKSQPMACCYDKSDTNADRATDAGEADYGGSIPGVMDKKDRHKERAMRLEQINGLIVVDTQTGKPTTKGVISVLEVCVDVEGQLTKNAEAIE
jgi:hypothetical protein